jgi:hypothetical protein
VLLGIGWQGGQAFAADDDHWWAFGTHEEAGLNYHVYAMTVYQDKLVIGGYPTMAGGLRIRRVALWDGESWTSPGRGVDDFDCPEIPCLGWVNALAVYDGSLIVGGSFPSVDGGIPANNIARWDGTQWHAMGEGLNDNVLTLVVYKGDLIAGGSFTKSGEMTVNRIARWNGSAWHPMGAGLNGSVTKLLVYGNEVVASGGFRQSQNLALENIARWDGSTWKPLGSGLDTSVKDALCVFHDSLMVRVGGYVAGQWIVGLAAWDGESWSPFGPQWADGGAFDCCTYEGKLVVTGTFMSIGSNVARWSGTSWEPLGSGLDAKGKTLEVHDRGLFVGGEFTMAGGKVSHYIARWDDVITPVAIEAFEATVTRGSIALSWGLGSWWEVQSVAVERAESAEGPYRMLARLAPQESMAFTDVEILADTEYWYRLALERKEGGFIVGSPLHVRFSESFEPGLLPPVFSQGRFVIRYRIAKPGTAVSLDAFNVRGQLLRVLDAGFRDPGEYVRLWDGRTEAGVAVPRGVYLIRLQAGRWVGSRKVVVTRE